VETPWMATLQLVRANNLMTAPDCYDKRDMPWRTPPIGFTQTRFDSGNFRWSLYEKYEAGVKSLLG
jgi:hypothetical protein